MQREETDENPKKKKKTNQFTLLDTNLETHSPSSIYSLSFNHLDPAYYSHFVTCNKSRLTFYKVEKSKIKPLKKVIDSDEKEVFYSVVWGKNGDGNPMVLAGGTTGILKLFRYQDPIQMLVSG